MTTTVVCVRGKSPDEWQAEPGNIYVARRYYIRAGQFEGQVWRPSLFGNPYKLPSEPTRSQRVECLEKFLGWLLDPAQKRVREQIPELRGKRLGCWCGQWFGEKKPCYLLCHAVVYAVLADHWRDGNPATAKQLVREWLALVIERSAAT